MDARQKLIHRFGSLPEPVLSPGDTSLLVVDIQYHNAHPDYGLAKRFKSRGLVEPFAYYTGRVKVAVANIQRLLAAFAAATSR